jgi:glycosyltransferase involved in cell wall biosynthesis
MRGAHGVIFNTRFQKKMWDVTYGIPGSKSHVVENFYPSVRASEAKNKIFVSAGRGIALKNYDLLARAFETVRARHPDIVLDTRVVSHIDHQARLRDAYAVLIPSFSEVSSNSAIDAVAHGKPFLMTEDTGVKERLSDCGIFVDTRSESVLVDAIERLLDEGEYARLTKACRAFSFTHSWDDIASEIINLV